MLCIANCCRNKTDILVKGLSYRGIKPYALGNVFNSILSYKSSSPCGPPKSGRGRRLPPCGFSGPTSGAKHNITYKSYVKPCYMDHDHKNMGLKRPMSPHLEIVSMTTPATMSILQRITGIIITTYALLLAGGTLFLSNGVETYVSIIQSLDLGETTIMILKICIGLPFTYHYFNGIRFCMWNTSRWLTMKEVSSTATMAIVGSLLASVFFALL